MKVLRGLLVVVDQVASTSQLRLVGLALVREHLGLSAGRLHLMRRLLNLNNFVWVAL